jgi:hypothetical protein
MLKQSQPSRTIWVILIRKFFFKAYKVCAIAGSAWLLVKVNTFNKCDNCYSAI